MGTRRRSTKPPTASQMRRRALVLVVDDTADNREMYMEYLRYVGFSVAGASTGEEAIEKARALGPAAIIMDLSLPGIDGWEATRILKSDPTTRDIVVLAVSGHAEPEVEKRAKRCGCDLFLTKPALPAEIAEHVVALLDRQRKAGSTSRRKAE